MSSHSRQALMPEEQNYVVLPQTQEPHSFLLTVDFEESFDWDEPSLSDHHSRDIEGMEKLHAFCVGRGIKPVYVVTYQVLESPQAAQFLAQALQRDECEVGIHLHAWNTPPLSDYDQTFQCDLPVAIEFEKLASLVALYRQVFDRQPLIHRAGRYGIDRCSFDNLAKLGLTIDLSPSAGFDFRSKGGPDFRAVKNQPFWVDSQHLLLSIPIPYCSFTKGPDFFSANFHWLARTLFPVEPVRLSPEGNSLARMKWMTQMLRKQGLENLVVTVHSTSFQQGGNPYSVDNKGVEHIFNTLYNYLDWCMTEQSMTSVTTADLWHRYANAKKVEA